MDLGLKDLRGDYLLQVVSSLTPFEQVFLLLEIDVVSHPSTYHLNQRGKYLVSEILLSLLVINALLLS